jgi:hypothetical protein
MIRNESIYKGKVDTAKSSMARMRVESVSERTLNTIAAAAPCERKNVIADKT